MNEADRVLNDLQDHLAERLHTVLMDTVDTMDRAGVSTRDAVASLLAALLRELVCGLETIGKADDEAALLAAYKLARRELHQAMAAEMARRGKAH